MFSNNMYKELEQLKARVGWLDHLDTEEGRRMHANEALLVEIEQLKAELGGVRDMLLDVANSGIEIDLKKYVTVQINRTTWDNIQTWSKTKEPT